MSWVKRTSLVFIVLLVCSTSLFAQGPDTENETLFAWEVKQIDEFIERFNDVKTTLLRKFTANDKVSKLFTRQNLIKSLFNTEDKTWNQKEVTEFISTITDSVSPVKLDFYSDDWYAELNCSVLWKGKAEKALLIMKVQRGADGTSKWVVTGVNAPFLRIPEPLVKTTSLNPLSHGTDFMDIDKISKDKLNIQNYFSNAADPGFELPIFMYECLNSRLTISRTNTVTFHFLQVDGWVFKVQQFSRQTRNAGWLISKLTKTSVSQKDDYRLKLLNRNKPMQ